MHVTISTEIPQADIYFREFLHVYTFTDTFFLLPVIPRKFKQVTLGLNLTGGCLLGVHAMMRSFNIDVICVLLSNISIDVYECRIFPISSKLRVLYQHLNPITHCD